VKQRRNRLAATSGTQELSLFTKTSLLPLTLEGPRIKEQRHKQKANLASESCKRLPHWTGKQCICQTESQRSATCEAETTLGKDQHM